MSGEKTDWAVAVGSSSWLRVDGTIGRYEPGGPAIRRYATAEEAEKARGRHLTRIGLFGSVVRLVPEEEGGETPHG